MLQKPVHFIINLILEGLILLCVLEYLMAKFLQLCFWISLNTYNPLTVVFCLDDPLALLPGPDICHVMSGQAIMMSGQVIRASAQISCESWSQSGTYRYTNVDVSVCIAQQSPQDLYKVAEGQLRTGHGLKGQVHMGVHGTLYCRSFVSAGYSLSFRQECRCQSSITHLYV